MLVFICPIQWVFVEMMLEEKINEIEGERTESGEKISYHYYSFDKK